MKIFSAVMLVAIISAISSLAWSAEVTEAPWQTWLHDQQKSDEERQALRNEARCAAVKANILESLENINKAWPDICKAKDAAASAETFINAWYYTECNRKKTSDFLPTVRSTLKDLRDLQNYYEPCLGPQGEIDWPSIERAMNLAAGRAEFEKTQERP